MFSLTFMLLHAYTWRSLGLSQVAEAKTFCMPNAGVEVFVEKVHYTYELSKDAKKLSMASIDELNTVANFTGYPFTG